MEGWIKLHRKLIGWEWYQDSNMVHLFIHLLLSANHKPGNWKGIDLERGQLITGRNKLSEQTGISHQSIRTCLERLKSTNELTIKSTNQYSILTICNYDDYQIENGEANQQLTSKPTNKQPATNQQLTTNKKEKNDNNEKEFKEEILSYSNEYGDLMLKEFFEYWAEWNPSKTKMRWQLEKTWQTDRRLSTWLKRSKDFKKPITESKGTNLNVDPIPEGYGERSSAAVQRGEYLKSKK